MDRPLHVFEFLQGMMIQFRRTVSLQWKPSRCQGARLFTFTISWYCLAIVSKWGSTPWYSRSRVTCQWRVSSIIITKVAFRLTRRPRLYKKSAAADIKMYRWRKNYWIDQQCSERVTMLVIHMACPCLTGIDGKGNKLGPSFRIFPSLYGNSILRCSQCTDEFYSWLLTADELVHNI